MLAKNEKIKQTCRKTRERRKSQICRVFEVKLDYSHLSRKKKDFLKMLFIEAKWLYNYHLSLEDPFDLSYKTKNVEVLNRNKEKEKRNLHCLSSQMRQALVGRLIQNIQNLSKQKKKGQKIGKLKFKSQVNSIPLPQYGITYKILNRSYVKIQGMGKKSLKVLGLLQIPKEADIANAHLIQRNGNFYLKVTTFLPKKERVKTGKVVGLDFGIKDSITDSDGKRYNFSFPEPEFLKKAARKLSRKIKGSKNREKAKLVLNKQYEKLTNQKKDVRNKFVPKLVKENDLIVIQDESIAGWKNSKMKGWGRRIQHSVMGGIISSLKNKLETLVIDKYFPSTQLCPSCGSLNRLRLEQRVYSCSCGYLEDRDVHAARNILNEGLRKLGRGPTKTMPVERKTSGLYQSLSQASLKQEACGFSHR